MIVVIIHAKVTGLAIHCLPTKDIAACIEALEMLSNVIISRIQNKKSYKKGAYIREGLIIGCIFMFTD